MTFAPSQKEKHRKRVTAGGDRLDYHADPSAPAVGILDTKLHLNSVISDADEGARYCVANIKYFLLNNQLKVPICTNTYQVLHG